MSLVQDLKPTNIAQEKEKFFDRDCKYNPQFKYSSLITLKKRLKYGKPQPAYLELAQEILDRAFHNQTEEQIRALEGPKLTKKSVNKITANFLKTNHLSEIVEVKYSVNFAGKASFYKNQLKLRLPIWHRRLEFLGTLYHEIGTHALRRINYSQQPFFKKKSKYGFSEYLFTEEGLASLHGQLPKNFQLDYQSALNYVLTQKALESSFVETYQLTREYLQDPERAWQFTYKHKRGMYDTSEPGGFTKDLVYFEGMIRVWQYLKTHNFDLNGLYYGKINLQDVEKAKEMNPDFSPQLPSFYKLNPDQYQEKISKIAELNQLDKVN